MAERGDRVTITLDERIAAFHAEAEAERLAAEDRRLDTDLDRHPDSPTLAALAIRDEAGAVVGRGCADTALGLAYEAGADAALIVEAERLVARVGNLDKPGHRYLALRLTRLVCAMNRRLAAFAGVRCTIGTFSVVQRVAVLRRTLAAVVQVTAERTVDHGHDPPRPIDAPTTSPHRPCAPPTPTSAGPKWLPRVGAVGNPTKGMGIAY